MAFTELIKQEARRRAGYKCCLCHETSVSVEVHHIIPQEENGPDTLENAAALCPSCHGDFGGNTEKQSRIREMRDWWYETVERMYKPRDFDALESLSAKLTDIGNNLPGIKQELKEFVDSKINEITPLNAQMLVSNLSTSAVVGLMPPSGDTWKKISDLEAENKDLRLKNDIRAKLSFKKGAYWADGDSEPFCSRCLEDESKAIHLHPDGNPAYYFCPKCRAESIMLKPELDRGVEDYR